MNPGSEPDPRMEPVLAEPGVSSRTRLDEERRGEGHNQLVLDHVGRVEVLLGDVVQRRAGREPQRRDAGEEEGHLLARDGALDEGEAAVRAAQVSPLIAAEAAGCPVGKCVDVATAARCGQNRQRAIAAVASCRC